MMGYDDMAVSFAISVGAGYVPNIVSLIKGSKTLNDKIDKCFRNALEKWDINEETRKRMRYDMLKHYSDLQNYLTDKSQGVHPKTKELLRLWVEELRNDKACMLFIVEHKQEVIDCKLDNVLETLKTDVSNKLDEILTNQSDLSDQMSQIISMLKDGKNSDDKLLATKIESILNSSVKDMIEALKVDTARKFLDEIEMQFAETLSKNETVNALLLYRKAQTLHWSSPKSAVEYYHKAYLKCPRNIEYVKSQIIRNIQLRDYSHAKELASDLDVNAPLIHLISIVESDEPKKVFLETPDSVRNDYTFRYDCLTLLISKDDIEDVSWLFDNIECDFPESVTFCNLRNWLFLLSYQRYKMGNFLFLSFEASQVKGLDEPLRIYGAFKDNIEKIELHGVFNDVLCLYCYWNYVKSQESRWISEFQYKASSLAGEQRSYFDLMEASMLSLAGRYEEAFVKIASLPFNLEMFRMLIMMAIHSKQESHVVWALEKATEQKISLPSDESSLVAHFLMHIKTAAVRSVLSGNDFDNPTDGLLLQEMCKYYEKIDFDETTFEGNVDSLCDHMKAYAAMLLAKKGKTKVAFDMLNPIVEKDGNCNITKRVFLDVLMQMQEKQGDLYSILVENRKAGNICDDDLLIEEYKLDSAVADYQNALEVITELKNRHDTTENYVHYLVTLGHVHPEDLKCHESKVLSISFDNTHFVAMLYKVFSENGYIITACELLWKYARTTEDYGLKMLFYNESMSGSLYSVVNEEYEIAREGNFVLCDIEGKRKMYKASDNGSDICKRLVGTKKDDLVVIEIGFEKQEARIIAVCNKYRKLAYDIMQESMDGSNPYMKPFKVDMEHPIESIEAMVKKISGNDMSPLDREKIAVEKYNRGKSSLIQLIDDVNVVSGYYKLLFSAFNVHTEPCKENLQKLRSIDLSSLKFVLDLPSVILFHEFSAVKAIELDGYPQITSLQVEQVEDFCKAPSRYLGLEIYEAMRSKHIKHYSEYVDEDAKCHLKNLLSWMKTHCEVIIPSQALPLITQKDSTPLKKQLFSALSTLMQPNYVFVTDDIRIKKMLPMVNIITTETYVRLFCNKETSEAYSKFLFDCHFDGIEMSEGFIIEQYMKMYNKEENDFVRIVQNMQSNPLLIDVVNNVGVKLVDKVLDIRTLQMTLTNMYAMLFKGLKPVAVDNIATIAQYEMDVNIFALQFVRQCMLDAILIVRS